MRGKGEALSDEHLCLTALRGGGDESGMARGYSKSCGALICLSHSATHPEPVKAERVP
jgi:hypothetical protein